MSSVLTITRDEYFTRDQPQKSEELVNYVEVKTQPLKKNSTTSTVFTSKETITLAPGGSYSFVAEYSSPPVATTGMVSSIIDADGGTLSLVNQTYYPWGAEITVENNDVSSGSGKVELVGYAFQIEGQETASSDDEDSIYLNGLQKYSYPDNHLVQSMTMAQLIADSLVASYKQYRKDVTVDWRGNPSLELGDQITVTEYERGVTLVQGDFKVYKNQMQYDGTFRQITDGRKI